MLIAISVAWNETLIDEEVLLLLPAPAAPAPAPDAPDANGENDEEEEAGSLGIKLFSTVRSAECKLLNQIHSESPSRNCRELPSPRLADTRHEDITTALLDFTP